MTASTTVPALDVRDVRKAFAVPDSPTGDLLVLDDVSLTIDGGQFVSVLGPSGCGKTTLARIITGIEDPTDGQILIDGADAGPPGPNRCLVFQNYGLLPWLTVRDNVELGMSIQGIDKRVRRERGAKYIEMVGLNGFEKRYPHEISGGMAQRTGLARALATEPRMLLMDEPFGAVDAQMRTLLQDELLKICEVTGVTVLFVTHSIDEAVYLSDKVVIFSARPGRPVATVDVNIPKPRWDGARSAPEFSEVRRQVTDLLAERTDYFVGDRRPTAIHID
jgi:ABC-type nitrate/sulfonate/bicarbonate transport system ATPase subunit